MEKGPTSPLRDEEKTTLISYWQQLMVRRKYYQRHCSISAQEEKQRAFLWIVKEKNVSIHWQIQCNN